MIVSNKYIKSTLDFAGKHLHAPEQRLILGATALATQPVIDAKNKDVDEKTRMTSVARTLAKIVAGTVVGVGMRYAGILGAKAFTKYDMVLNPENANEVLKIVPRAKRSQLVPLFALSKKMYPIPKNVLENKFNKYTKAVGIFVATVAMVFTNFLLDAPLTKALTKYFTKKLEPKPNESEVHK